MPSRRDSGSWMWAEAVELLDRAERLHRQFFRPGRPNAACATWTPPVDVYETAAEVLVVAALPGVLAGQVEVAVEHGVLRLAGERTLPCPRTGAIHRMEIPHGRFERRVELPAGACEVTRTELVAGCLVLTLRKPG
ncbi:MAG TPA: Hsp20/alpha crystallin family protein [Azospirillum sp.]|nr:Hsp20/alpha crystallin family protein [Azospirillum sp.]